MINFNENTQKILVLQQRERAASKINWIKQKNKGLFTLQIINITSKLPKIIDDTSEYLPKIIQVDLVLDYLEHPDLSNDLVKLCIAKHIPIISSGKKISLGNKHYTPMVCCALNKSPELGEYSKLFGKPNIDVSVNNDIITNVKVLHGSPCGSTWKAAKKILGLTITDAITAYGLNVQYFCTAKSTNWDPITGKNPIHTAAEIHTTALISALSSYMKNLILPNSLK